MQNQTITEQEFDLTTKLRAAGFNMEEIEKIEEIISNLPIHLYTTNTTVKIENGVIIIKPTNGQ